MSESPQPETQIIRVTGQMMFQIDFPVTIFDPLGELTYRLHRTKTLETLPFQIREQLNVTDFAKVYDGLYEIARLKLMQDDPQGMRPQRAGVAPLRLNMNELQQAIEEEIDGTGSDEQGMDGHAAPAPEGTEDRGA